MKRAREVTGLLEKAGLRNADFTVETARLEARADGIDDWMSRRVSVVVAP